MVEKSIIAYGDLLKWVRLGKVLILDSLCFISLAPIAGISMGTVIGMIGKAFDSIESCR